MNSAGHCLRGPGHYTSGMAKTPRSESQPVIRLKAQAHKRVAWGHPWVYSNEIEIDATAKALPPGCVVRLASHDRRPLGTAIFNRMPLIAARILSTDPKATIDADFFADRLARALAIRERLYDQPYYRLIHAEADGLPGTVIDRFDQIVVLQVNTAGMDRLLPDLLAAIDRVLAPETVLLRNDSTARQMEGLEMHATLAKGALNGPIEVLENDARYLADLTVGQKTGWFYDQRDNRAAIARFASQARVLDAYCYSGGFTIQAAMQGADQVVAIDRSQAALGLAAAAAERNGVAARCSFVKAEVFDQLQLLAEDGDVFDLVIVDPPAFVKSKRDRIQGAKGYRKLGRLAARLVAPGGYLFAASCSHHVDPVLFGEQIKRGLHDAGRRGRVLMMTGAAPDHPVHPALPESAYLKAQILALD